MRKRGIATALAGVLLSLTLCGCWQDKWYSEDAYKQNYRNGFDAGVNAAREADAAHLMNCTETDIEYERKCWTAIWPVRVFTRAPRQKRQWMQCVSIMTRYCKCTKTSKTAA